MILLAQSYRGPGPAIITGIVGLIVLWVIIRSAVLSAMEEHSHREHERAAGTRPALRRQTTTNR